MLDVGSPFDYEANSILYCPVDLPDPRAADATEARHAELEALIVAAGGRTLALFTSWAAMRDAAEHLDPRLPWPVLVQGEGSKAALLEEFTADDEASLFATMSFWQGVDVPGATCTLVVIDRLPFPRPDDPVLQARRDRAGSAAFRTIDLPRAATLLAQGAGRLIRSSEDRGVVAVLDPAWPPPAATGGTSSRHSRRCAAPRTAPRPRICSESCATPADTCSTSSPRVPIDRR